MTSLWEFGLDVNAKNRKEFMVDRNLIRYPIMTEKEFVLGPAKTNMLTCKEKCSILLHITAKTQTTFITKKRV